MTTRTDVERAAKAFRDRKAADDDSDILAAMNAESKRQEKDKENEKGLFILKVAVKPVLMGFTPALL